MARLHFSEMGKKIPLRLDAPKEEKIDYSKWDKFHLPGGLRPANSSLQNPYGHSIFPEMGKNPASPQFSKRGKKSTTREVE
jgi:hypothetical protein